MLDIGCGWGGLICHAARTTASRPTASRCRKQQYDYAQAKDRRLGLQDRVTSNLRDYALLDGSYDKIASIGMFEHVGIANFPAYFGKTVSRCSATAAPAQPRHHAPAPSRRAASSARSRPEQRLIGKYIFPGGELDHIGHTCEAMEARFEVHDVEGWREHYALTHSHWCQRLTANRDEAIRLSAPNATACGWPISPASRFGFQDGTLRIFQVVAASTPNAACRMLPLTRADLYATAATESRKKAA